MTSDDQLSEETGKPHAHMTNASKVTSAIEFYKSVRRHNTIPSGAFVKGIQNDRRNAFFFTPLPSGEMRRPLRQQLCAGTVSTGFYSYHAAQV